MALVVIDSSFCGKGRYRPEQLERIITDVDLNDLEVVVPEVVIWEWAEHLHMDLDELRSKQSSLKIDPSVVKLSEIPTPSIEDVVERLTAAVQKYCTVWSSDAGAYQKAVQAQVLQQTTGTRSKGTKTGAADSLVYQCIEAQLDEHEDSRQIILASCDKGLCRVCLSHFEDRGLVVANQHNEILQGVLSFVPAEHQLLESSEWFLRAELPETGLFAYGFSVYGYIPDHVDVEGMGPVGEITVSSLNVLGNEDKRLASAEVRIVGDVNVVAYEVQQVGEDEFERVAVESGTREAVVELPMTIRFDTDWEPIDAAPSGRATIDLRDYDG